mmetsp:Transcript_14044/g.31804  ORF Transcript_14044/g.31804 Transcript_14044/m.31804 type:complete len:808 (-) Transcript_14044:48-2471(-)
MSQKKVSSRDSGDEKVVESRRGFLGFGRQHSEDSAPGASSHFPRMHSAFTDPTTSRQTVGSFQFTASQDMETKKENKPVFVDAESMKAKVRQNLRKRQHNVKDYYKDKGVWQAIAKNPRFEVLTLAVIALNSIWIAVDTDLNDADILLNAHPVFQAAEHFFCAFFFFEWSTRYLAFRRKRDCLKDAWFLFDSGLVFMMVSETWIMTCITLVVGPNSGGGAGNTSVLRIARLLRLTRMARMARLLRAMPELMILIKGMLAASRSVVFTLLLLLILMYVFAIAMTQLLAESDIGAKSFPTVLASMYTLWLRGTLLDDVNTLQKHLARESVACTVIFFVFVLLAALTVMNMLIGILCEVVSAVAATEKEEMLVAYVNDKLHNIVKLLDQNGDMKISKSEFMQILENPEACRCLDEIGVDVFGLIDSVDAIFSNTKDWHNQDDEGEQLDFSKFMEVVLQLRGSNTATVKDVVDLKKFVRDAVHHTNELLRDFQDDMKKYRDALGGKASEKPKRGESTRSVGARSHKELVSDLQTDAYKNWNGAIHLDEVALLEEPSSSRTPDFLDGTVKAARLDYDDLDGNGHYTGVAVPKLHSEVNDRVPTKLHSKGRAVAIPVKTTCFAVSGALLTHDDVSCMVVPSETTPVAELDLALTNGTTELHDELEEEVVHLDTLAGSWWPCHASKKVVVRESTCCSSTPSAVPSRSSSRERHRHHQQSTESSSPGRSLLPEFDAASFSHREKLHSTRHWRDEAAMANALESEDMRLIVSRVSQALIIALKDLQVMQRMSPPELAEAKRQGSLSPAPPVNGIKR